MVTFLSSFSVGGRGVQYMSKCTADFKWFPHHVIKKSTVEIRIYVIKWNLSLWLLYLEQIW